MPSRRSVALLAAAVLLGCPQPAALAAGGWVWPVDGALVTPFENGDDPYERGRHRGIDIAAAPGTPVRAARAGTVRFAGVAGSSGLTVSVRTADGALDTSYLHLASVAVRAGDRVTAGARIGAAGTGGRRSSRRPHLHFGVRAAGSRHAYRDPLRFLPLAPRSRPRGSPGTPRVPAVPPSPVLRPLAPVPGGERSRAPAPRPRAAPAAPRRAGRGAVADRARPARVLACLGLLLAAACLLRPRGRDGRGCASSIGRPCRST